MIPKWEVTMRHGLYLQNGPGYLGEMASPENLLEYAIAAEEAGWDGVFMADAIGTDHIFVDPWTTLSGIATRTDRIRLGTWITPLPRRQPWQIASDLATLDVLSGGRVLLGAGFGAPWNYESTGIGYDPTELARRYDESLEIILGLWEGEVFSYDGDVYTIEEIRLPVTPVQDPRIPIWMGFWWPNKKPIERAARFEGIMPCAPSFYGSEGVQGEPITGTMYEEVSDIITTYKELAEQPGEILIPIDTPEAPDGFRSRCPELGVTWTLTTSLLDDEGHETNLERILAGPPDLESTA